MDAPNTGTIPPSKFWPRFRETYGPALIGLVGGAATAGLGLIAVAPILHNVSQTYANFQSLPTPWFAGDWNLPLVLHLILIVVGITAPLAIGLVTARLVRPKDRWAAVSAGLTAGATASAAAYILWIGWLTTLATAVVPSVSDMTLLGNATRTPEVSLHPSDTLVESYPDLQAVSVDERGGRFFAKIVSDQVVGSASGVLLGVLISIACIGAPAFCGTLAATWLLRQGGAWCPRLSRYIEMTAGIAVPLGLLVMMMMLPVGFSASQPMPWLRFAAVVGLSAVMIAGAVQRWSWPIRVVAAVAWVAVLLGFGFGERSTTGTLVVTVTLTVGLAVLLVRELRLQAQFSKLQTCPT